MIDEKDGFVLNGLAANGQVHQHLKQQAFGVVEPGLDIVHGSMFVPL